MNIKNRKNYFKETIEKTSIGKEEVLNTEFEDCTFEKCSFIETTFRNCRLIDCSFSESTISATKLFNSTFSYVNFDKCKVIGIDWTKAKNIHDLDFNECEISYSNFRMLKLPGLKLLKCVAHEVDFTETSLEDGNFQETDFTQSIFFNTNLIKADFRKATNYFIDINTNKLKKAKFSYPDVVSLLKSLDIKIEF